MLHGRFLAALRLNPLVVLVLPILGYTAVSRARAFVGGRTLPGIVVPSGWIWGLIGLILAFGVARNLPGPFAVLAP